MKNWTPEYPALLPNTNKQIRVKQWQLIPIGEKKLTFVTTLQLWQNTRSWHNLNWKIIRDWQVSIVTICPNVTALLVAKCTCDQFSVSKIIGIKNLWQKVLKSSCSWVPVFARVLSYWPPCHLIQLLIRNGSVKYQIPQLPRIKTKILSIKSLIQDNGSKIFIIKLI